MTTVDPKDKQRWKSQDWDQESPLNALKLYTPLRVDFLRAKLRDIKPSGKTTPGLPLSGYRILDVGCGPGYVSDALAAEGAEVDAIDCNEKVIQRNRILQGQNQRAPEVDNCRYTVAAIEDVVRARSGSGILKYLNPSYWLGNGSSSAYDVIVASEVIEHVQSPKLFLSYADQLLKPGGLLMVTCPNRTALSRLTVVKMAEDVLKLADKGTHDWSKFIRHDELAYYMNAADLPERNEKVKTQLMKFLAWPRLSIRQRLCQVPAIPPTSPLRLKDGEARVPSRYTHLGTQGSIFLPKLNMWARIPCRSVAYMAAFKKSESPVMDIMKAETTGGKDAC
eukprot:Blabericola_migrator_1__1807@NODE_148_length_12903_cov_144_651293_g129_i0_p4_GENE_NODE_148_length_12903_cov_144_651293_g129_i0NODE_148_length_12903_cov_144_651293_g129_i0_p4_ORF_typecomplete_len336_score53_53Methyltransf_23/PF13489_6/4_4e26Methyltransf_31/PF13847_6/1_4e19Methyltransf_11/PF08241_12/8_3e14Methyltransf_12/PF08242_12/6_2e13Methyltransf_25/PF13649_6/4_7e03Methyltransf_25/PF13649_6/2_9e10Methyltransf_9/PF08003_11/3_3e09NodS/PF05401_11/1_3e08NodS/PF05401_11/1_1e03TehB/PF03848_14/2_2e07